MRQPYSAFLDAGLAVVSGTDFEKLFELHLNYAEGALSGVNFCKTPNARLRKQAKCDVMIRAVIGPYFEPYFDR